MSPGRGRSRGRSGGRRLARWVVALVALAAVVFGGLTLYRDVKADRALSSHGVKTTGTLVDKGCWLCKAVAVDFTTTSGQKVSGVVSAIGPQQSTTIHLRYDSTDPKTVQPAHGVREEEGIAAGLVVVGLLVLLRLAGLPRRRARRSGRLPRRRPGSSLDATGHVRLLGGP